MKAILRREHGPYVPPDPGVRSLETRQSEFAAAVLDPTVAVPVGITGPDGRVSARRFNVYRNNVVVGLIHALRAAFPATNRIVGDDFFTAMARAFVVSEPPSSPMMFDYGARFPDFIQRFEPVAQLNYLPDVARLERAWVEAYYAAEAEALDLRYLHHVSPDSLPMLTVALHPSLRLVRSSAPVLTIWQMNTKPSATDPTVSLDMGGEDVLVVRPDAHVELRLLPEGGAQFLLALHDGCPIADATDIAMRSNCNFDLARTLCDLIGARVFVGFGCANVHPMAQFDDLL